MRIVDIRETAIPLNSTLANSGFNFSEMTTSLVAVITDVKRGGKPVTGFAFNSTGRYACGAQMRARFIPRVLNADPQMLLDEAGDNFAPEKILAAMMQNEKSGGHSERSIGIGTIEVAVWDAVAKIAGKPLHVVLAERYNGGKIADKVFCYVGAGWYAPGKDHAGPGRRDAPSSRCRLHDAENESRRLALGGRSRPRCDGEGDPATRRHARGRRQFEIFPRRCARLCARLAGIRFALVRGAVRSARLCAACRDRRQLRCAAVDRRESVFDPRRGEPGALRRIRPARRDVIQVDPPQAYGIVQYARTLDMLARHQWPRALLFPHGGKDTSLAITAGFGLGGAESYPGVFGDFRRLRRRCEAGGRPTKLSDRPGIGFEGQARLYRIMLELAA